MRGESNNVTILCLEQFFFEFIESSDINIIFRNCGAYSSNNYTLVFNKHRGNVLLDHIKIKSIDGAGISVKVMGQIVSGLEVKVNLTNSMISTLGTGIYVDNQFLLLSSRIVVHIYKTYFNQSCLVFRYDRDKMKKIQIHDVVYVVLKNISVDNSTCWSALKFTGSNNMKTNLSLQDVRIVNNKSPIATPFTITEEVYI